MNIRDLSKRLDAVETRNLIGRTFIFINHHAEQPADGLPYRRTGEPTTDCQARYGIQSGICIFLDLTGECCPRPK